MQPLLGIDVLRLDASAVVALSGEADLSGASALRAALHNAVTWSSSIVVDLTALSYIDSSGVQELLRAKRDATDVGATLVVRGASGIVHRVFELMEVEKELSVD
jgi:anti-sigma B factor antagonist